MKTLTLTLLTAVIACSTSSPAADGPAKSSPNEPLTTSAGGAPIPHPTSTKTYSAKDDSTSVSVPEGMVYVPAGKFTFGEGATAKEIALDGFCIGRFEVTNVEWKQFLDATGGRAPRYWKSANFPAGKANHPVLFVSLVEAQV